MVAWALANVPITVERGQISQAMNPSESNDADHKQTLDQAVADTLALISDPYVKIHSQTKNV